MCLQTWDYVGDCLQLVFAIELSIKLVVFNRREFFGSLLNRLDLVTVITSILFNAAQNFFWKIDMISEAGADMVQVRWHSKNQCFTGQNKHSQIVTNAVASMPACPLV